MKKFLIFGIITFLSTFISARNLDFMVKSNGESFACIIDSVPENNINPDNYNFTKETSVSRSAKKDSISKMADIKKKSVYFQLLSFEFPSLNFEGRIPFGNAAGLTIGVGGIYDYGTIFSRISVGVIFGGPHHFVQTELIFVANYYAISAINYNYQSKSGIFLKGGVVIGAMIKPAIGIGYAF